MIFRLFAVAVLLASVAAAQDYRATITGQVTDRTGGAIPNARVRAIQRGTNEATSALTDQDGFFALLYLQPGNFRVEIEAAGFSTQKHENVTLLVAQKLDFPVKLEVGKVGTEITVVAEAAALQTADASGGVNFDALQTSEYALNGRQVYMLMDLVPGVLFTQEQFGSSGYS